MNDVPSDPPSRSSDSARPGEPGAYSQAFNHSPVAARVPERLARGVLSTGVLVLDGPNEFVLDFVQGLSRPAQVVARVVLAPAILSQLVTVAKDNFDRYVKSFGSPPPLPPPPAQRPTLVEIYEHFKLPDELLSGSYANAVVVGHSASEFCFDFITGFYPTAAVSARVYLSAPQVPRVLEALAVARQRHRQPPQLPPAEVPDE